MNNKIDVSVIIVNYKSKKEIFDCLTSIFKSDAKISLEIIIVDNDEKIVIKKNLQKKFPSIKYIKSLRNVGFGAANNLGARYARGRYLFFLNPDTKIFKNTINSLYEFIDKNKKTAIVAPLLLDKSKRPYLLQGAKELTPFRAICALSFIEKFFPKNRIYKDYYLYGWNKKDNKEVDVVPGAAFIIRNELFKKIGGFDENFFLFFEELDLCKKVNELGYKIFIIPKAKAIHLWGASTGRSKKDMKKIFSESRFYYFKKHFGLPKAVIAEVFLRADKFILFLIFTIAVSLFLRVFRLNQTMSFIGDQGWFYLSARDMVLTGKIPLVGITSSHIWLHQGPLWTYILGVIFLLANFNPLAPAYFTVFFGVISTLFIYKVGSELFSKQLGLLSGLLYATSPLIIFYDRMPYHTTLIPLFSLLFILFIFKWLKGRVLFFPLIILVLSILYNFELATTSLWAIPIVFIIYGIYKNKAFAVNLKDPKIILISIFSFAVPMIPILIYDFNHGFPQTFKFIVWIFYKFLRLIGFPSINLIPAQSSYPEIINFFLKFYKKIIFVQNFQVALVILLLSFSIFSWIIYKGIRQKNLKPGYIVLAAYFLIFLLGFLIARTPSEAYLPVFFAPLIIVTSLAINKIIEIKNLRVIGFLILVCIVILNINYIFSNIFSNDSFNQRIRAVDKIIQLTKGQNYNLIGRGEGSQFESFTMNYEYLLWWKGHPPSKNPVSVKIYVEEKEGKILVSRND